MAPKASQNSSFVIGKLVCELYHLVLRHAAAEEHFLTLRTLLLHIYAVALDSQKQVNQSTRSKTAEKNKECGRIAAWLKVVVHEARRVLTSGVVAAAVHGLLELSYSSSIFPSPTTTNLTTRTLNSLLEIPRLSSHLF